MTRQSPRGLAPFIALVALLIGPLAADEPPATGPARQSPPTQAPAPQAPASTAPRDLSALLETIRSKHDLPALAAAVVDHEQLRAIGAAGIRRRGGEEAVTPDDLFHIGSCTKAMTATLCAILVEEGALRWDLTLAEAFPDLAERMHPRYRAVTVEQLLTHRAGFPEDLTPDGLWARLWMHEGTPTQARRMLLHGVVMKAPVVEPGTTYLYSNAGFATAGHIAETATGTAFEELMRERLFDTLKMTSAGFGPPGSADDVDQPRGHLPNGHPAEPGKAADNPTAVTPAGRVHCTLADWGRFISLHLRGGQGRIKLLKAETFARLHEPASDDPPYAMGWIVARREWGGGAVLTHAGTNTLWFAVVWAAPERDFAVLVACNQGGEVAAKACDDAAAALIQEWREVSD